MPKYPYKTSTFEEPNMQARFIQYGLMLCLLPACKLFKPKEKTNPIPVKTDYFSEMAVPRVVKALALDYKVFSNGSYHDFSVFPRTDSAYECDYLVSGNQGYLFVQPGAVKNARRYNNYFGKDSLILTDMCAIWLTRLNYEELKHNGFSVMDFGHNTPDTFKVVGNDKVNISADDSAIWIPIVKLKSKKYNYTLDFIPNAKCPLIVNQSIGFTVNLEHAQLRESEYYNYTLGPKSVLRYSMLEYGTNEYNFTATNVLWTDTLVCFHIDGNYTGSPSYNFEYDVFFRKDAVSNPVFAPPIFTAMSGKLVEDKENFIFLRKNEIESMQKTGAGFLTIPHFAPSLSDGDTTGFSPEDIEDINRKYAESYHTYFKLMRSGRLIHTGYYYTDEDDNSEKILPSLSFRNSDRDFEVQVLNTGKFPLLLYYNDDMQWEITLEYAGFTK